MADPVRDEPRLVYGSRTVAGRLLGCWDRCYIRFPDGTEDFSTRVIWIQTLAGVADIRIPATQPDLRDRTGLADCSTEELLALAEQDCFCGVTLFDSNSQPFPTASWPPESYLFRFQPVITFPESGWMEWLEGGTCMVERAPSGAYVEDWRLRPGSRSFGAHLTQPDASLRTCLYVAGDHAIFARDRTAVLPTNKSLVELAQEATHDHRRLQLLLDCEFSYAHRGQPGRDYEIKLSTFPWRVGQSLGCPWVQALGTQTAGFDNLLMDGKWAVQNFWRF